MTTDQNGAAASQAEEQVLDAIDPELVSQLAADGATKDGDGQTPADDGSQATDDIQKQDAAQAAAEKFLAGEFDLDGETIKIEYADKESALKGWLDNEKYIRQLKADRDAANARELELLRLAGRSSSESKPLPPKGDMTVEEELAANPLLKRAYDRLSVRYDPEDALEIARTQVDLIQESKRMDQVSNISESVESYISKKAKESPDSGLLDPSEASAILESRMTTHPKWAAASTTLEFYREAVRIGDPERAYNQIFKPGFVSKSDVDEMLKKARQEGAQDVIKKLLEKQAKLKPSPSGGGNQELAQVDLTKEQRSLQSERAAEKAVKNILKEIDA